MADVLYILGAILMTVSVSIFIGMIVISYLNKKRFIEVCRLYESKFGENSLPLDVAVLKDADVVGLSSGYSLKMRFIFDPLIHRKKMLSSRFNDVEFMDSMDKKIKSWFKIEYYLFKIAMILFISSTLILLYEHIVNFVLVIFSGNNLSMTNWVLLLLGLMLTLSFILKVILLSSSKTMFITVCEHYEKEVGELPKNINLYLHTSVVGFVEANIIKSSFISKPLVFRNRFIKKKPMLARFMKKIPQKIKNRFILEYILDVIIVSSMVALLLGAYIKFKYHLV